MTKNDYGFLLFAALILRSFWVTAQDKDLFGTTYQYTKINAADTSRNVQSLNTYVAFPLVHRDQHTLIGVVNFQSLWLNGFGAAFPDHVYGTGVDLIYQFPLSARKSLCLFASAGAYSDCRNILFADVRGRIGGEYVIRYANDFKLGFGLAYAAQFFANQIIPVIEVDKRFNEHWRISGIFPLRPKLEYQINKKSSAGLALNVDVSSYRFSGAADEINYLKSSGWKGSVFYEYTIFRHWKLNLSAGANIRQRFEIYSTENPSSWILLTRPIGEQAIPVSSLQKSSLLVQGGLAYSLH